MGLRMNPDASLPVSGVMETLSGRYSRSRLNISARISTHRISLVSLDSVDDSGGNRSRGWTCSLSRADPCEGFRLAWDGSSAGSQQGGAVEQTNTPVSRPFLPKHLHTLDRVVCVVLSDRTEQVRQEWTPPGGNQVAAPWFLLLASILLVGRAAAAVYVKRRREKHAGNFLLYLRLSARSSCMARKGKHDDPRTLTPTLNTTSKTIRQRTVSRISHRLSCTCVKKRNSAEDQQL
ncbi:hypothetical protein GN956_G10204 [Arapaima gigas]